MVKASLRAPRRSPRRNASSPSRLRRGRRAPGDRAARQNLYVVPHSFGNGFIHEESDAASYGASSLHHARTLDRELLHLARDDGTARLVLGRLANRFIRMRGWERFGLARLGDYAAEKLGLSGRQLEQLALVARRLVDLPLIETALRNGTLSWSKTRLLDGIATASDESKWLAVAGATNVRTLAAITANVRAAMREQRQLAEGLASPAPSESADDDDAEERVRVRLPCTKRTARAWGQVRRHAARMAGRALSVWQVAELVAAEASSVRVPFDQLWQQEPWRTLASRSLHDDHPPSDFPHEPDTVHRSRRTAESAKSGDSAPPASCHAEACRDAALHDSPFEREIEKLEELDIPELDAAMRRVRRAMQQRQARLGIDLATFLDLRFHEELGYTCGSEYVRERLGMSERTTRELIRVARAARNRSPLLASAYARGDVSWLQVLTLLPVVRACNAAAWVERAGEVTLRRLADEVDWVLDRLDLDPANAAAVPPAPNEPLVYSDERQMCAGEGDGRNHGNHATTSKDELWGITGRIHVSFVAPRTVAILFRSVMQGFAAPTEPRWKAFERMIDHVLAQWRSFPKHHDPVFARDGYRCTAPACSSFSNLHDHHIVPRSASGSNDLGNRTTLCAWHHLRAVHGGLARVTGQAPDDLDWEMGLCDGEPPLMHLHGERYVHDRADRDACAVPGERPTHQQANRDAGAVSGDTTGIASQG